MKKTLLSFTCFIFFSSFVISQGLDTTMIRLKKTLKNSPDKCSKVQVLIEIGEHQIDQESHFAEQYFLDAWDIIESSSCKQKELQKAKLNFLMGTLHKKSENFSLALTYYFKSLSYYQSVKDTLSLSRIYDQIAESYQIIKENDSAIVNYRKAIILERRLGNINELADSYYRMGISHIRLGKKDSALTYYNKAKELFALENNQGKIHKVKHRIARVLLKKGLYKDAKKILLENLAYYKRANDPHSECTAEYDMSLFYRDLVMSNSSVDYDKGLTHAENALKIAEEKGYSNKIAKAYKLKAFFYVQKGNYEKAFQSFKKYDAQNLKMFNAKEAKKIHAIKAHYQFREDRKALESEADKERSLRILYVTLFIITLSGSLIIGFFVRKNFFNKVKISEQELEKEKIQKELLKQQVKASEAEIKFLISDNKMKLLSKKELLQQLKKEESLTSNSEEIKKFVRGLIYKINQQVITEDRLLAIQSKIDEVDKGFDRKIRKLYPDLTKNEREVCILLRLNLSIKEIVSIKNTTVDSIKSIRYRIRKKIGLSPGEELEKKIQDI